MPRATSPLTRALGAVVVASTIATGCYRYETPRFEITIPEQAESSIIVAGGRSEEHTAELQSRA